MREKGGPRKERGPTQIPENRHIPISKRRYPLEGMLKTNEKLFKILVGAPILSLSNITSFKSIGFNFLLYV